MKKEQQNNETTISAVAAAHLCVLLATWSPYRCSRMSGWLLWMDDTELGFCRTDSRISSSFSLALKKPQIVAINQQRTREVQITPTQVAQSPNLFRIAHAQLLATNTVLYSDTKQHFSTSWVLSSPKIETFGQSASRTGRSPEVFFADWIVCARTLVPCCSPRGVGRRAPACSCASASHSIRPAQGSHDEYSSTP